MANTTTPLQGVKALFFDVFGTVVDWRSTVTRTLVQKAEITLYLSDCSIPMNVRAKASKMGPEQWGEFAQAWRQSYYTFTREIASDPSLPYKTVDEHHFDAIKSLLEEWGLAGLWNANALKELSLVWHKLDGWPDSSEGIRALNQRFQTCTLSNGNVSLLTDMAEHAKLEWTHVISAEMFQSFKPNPRVYLGAAERLNLPPSECAMVAAHLNDLKAASEQGFRTIYVERPQEEQWDKAKVAAAKQDGWVDIWVEENEDGFRKVAEIIGS